MNYWTIKLPNFKTILITSEKNIHFEEYKSILSKLIPFAELTNENAKGYDYRVQLRSTEINSMFYDENQMNIEGELETIDVTNFIYSILAPVAQYFFEIDSYYLLHCASILYDEKAYLISGVGKSTYCDGLDEPYIVNGEDSAIINYIYYPKIKTLDGDAKIKKIFIISPGDNNIYKPNEELRKIKFTLLLNELANNNSRMFWLTMRGSPMFRQK